MEEEINGAFQKFMLSDIEKEGISLTVNDVEISTKE